MTLKQSNYPLLPMAVTMPDAQVATIVMQTRKFASDVPEEACDVFYS